MLHKPDATPALSFAILFLSLLAALLAWKGLVRLEAVGVRQFMAMPAPTHSLAWWSAACCLAWWSAACCLALLAACLLLARTWLARHARTAQPCKLRRSMLHPVTRIITVLRTSGRQPAIIRIQVSAPRVSALPGTRQR